MFVIYILFSVGKGERGVEWVDPGASGTAGLCTVLGWLRVNDTILWALNDRFECQ